LLYTNAGKALIKDSLDIIRAEMAILSVGTAGNADSLGGKDASAYALNDSIQTWAETEALISALISDSLVALYDSIAAIRLTTGYTVDDSPYDILSPDTVYLATSQSNYIFYDNIGKSPSISFTPDSGDAYATNWAFTPVTSGDFSFYLVADQDTFHTIMHSGTGDVMATRGKLLAIGDSRTAGGQWVTELKTLIGDSLTLIGTLGTPPYLHEGISGWAYQTFCTNVASPFAPNGYVDFAGYMTDNSFDSLTYVIIRLGTNDVFSANSSTITATITTALNYADSLINSIHSYDASVFIALCMETPPANDSTFTATYSGTQSYTQYKSNIHEFNKALKAKYGNGGTRELSYVSLIPLYLSSDKDNDFTNGVHENATGYEKNAIPMMGWIWSKKLVYGESIVVNGTFDSNIDSWTDNSGNTPILEWSDGQAHISADGANDGMLQMISIEAGKTYNFSYNINIISGDAIRVGIFLTSYQDLVYHSTLGEYTHNNEFTATETGSAYLWTFTNTGGAEWYIDNISLREKY